MNEIQGRRGHKKTFVQRERKKEERIKAEMYYASRGLFLQYTTQQLIVALVMNDKSMCNAN